jgi:hypothetical protein
MPVGPWPVNDGPCGPVNWRKHGGWMPPLAIPSLEFERGPRTTHEYGLSAARRALKFRFQEGAEGQLRQAELGFGRVSNTGQFRLTMRGGEAYIRVLGAPSAYGAIARL